MSKKINKADTVLARYTCARHYGDDMNIVSNAKEIADLIKKLGDVKLYRKIVSDRIKFLFQRSHGKRNSFLMPSAIVFLNHTRNTKTAAAYKMLLAAPH